jgi:hypothetical protein
MYTPDTHEHVYIYANLHPYIYKLRYFLGTAFRLLYTQCMHACIHTYLQTYTNSDTLWALPLRFVHTRYIYTYMHTCTCILTYIHKPRYIPGTSTSASTHPTATMPLRLPSRTSFPYHYPHPMIGTQLAGGRSSGCLYAPSTAGSM